MLVAHQYGFLFVANLRTASSSIHSALAPLAELELGVTAGGKHLTLREIHERFGSEAIAPLYTWAVVREPVSYLWSLYRFHKRPGFDGGRLSTRGVSFEEFYFADTHAWMRRPQAARFAGPGGEYGLDLLLRFEHVRAGLAYLKLRLGLPNVLIPTLNVSDRTPPHVPPALVSRIRDDYAVDYEMIDRYGDRERTDDGFVRVLSRAPAFAGG